MPRKRELTWQAGSQGRPGRWRKVYHGKPYYFDGGRGKSDDAAYQAAIASWRQQEQLLKSTAPNPLQAEYEREISKWGEVLTWSRQHGEQQMADRATDKLRVMREELARSKPRPLAAELTFDGYFDPEIRNPALMQSMREILRSIDRRNRVSFNSEEPTSWDRLKDIYVQTKESAANSETQVVIEPDASHPIGTIDTLEIERQVWFDRLEVSRRSVTEADQTVAAQIEIFLRQKTPSGGTKGVSLSRLSILRHHLGRFAEWIGGGMAVDKIGSKELMGYRQHLLEKVAAGKAASTTADGELSSVKGFVLWLWQSEAIKDLPRVMASQSKMLQIGKSKQNIVTFTEVEIATLLQQASSSTRLFILLTLNTGMTQKDIADLDYEEVDWKQGRINRKRSKTRQFKNVPCVSYLLWPETRELLVKFRSDQNTGRVLLNRRGEPLLTEHIDAAGKFKKTDNVRRAFGRLRQKTGIHKPFKSLKKTSASTLRSNSQFESVVGLFLGHAPREISDRHYAAAPQQLLDEAICWLHDHFAAHSCFAEKASLASATKQ